MRYFILLSIFYVSTQTQPTQASSSHLHKASIYDSNFKPKFESDAVSSSTVFVDTNAESDALKTNALNAPACSTTGIQPTLLILGKSPTSIGTLLPRSFYEEFMFGSSFPTVRTYYEEASYGKTSLAGDVSDWLDLPFYPGCDYASIVNATLQVAEPRFDLSKYNRITMIGAGWSGCYFSGISSLGCRTFTLPSGALWTGSISFADDKYTNSNYSPLQKTQIMIHEFGHALGLGHSNLRAQREGTPNAASGYMIEPVGPVSGSWNNQINLEYGDLYSVMGLGASNHISAHHKKRMSWLNPYDPSGTIPGPYYLDVTEDGEYLIEPMHLQSNGIKALRVNRSIAGAIPSQDYYWIEFRRRAGYDQEILDRDQYLDGALIHLEYPGQREFSHVLDFNPGDGLAHESTLELGKTFADPYLSTFSIGAIDITEGRLRVRINRTQTECNGIVTSYIGLPAGSLTTPNKSHPIILSLKNNNHSSCLSQQPEVQIKAPNGWAVTLPSPLPVLENKTLTAIPASINIPKGTKPYSYGITSISKIGTASGESIAQSSVTVSKEEVATSLIKTGNRSYLLNVLGHKANKPDKPIEKIYVSWTLTPTTGSATGKTLSSSGQTNSSGKIAWTINIPDNFPAGNYQISFTSLYKSSPVFTAPKTLTIQVE